MEKFRHISNSLILSKPRKFYCAPMRSKHWQLRSLVVSPRPNTLYYPSGHDVFVLDTKTRESYLLVTLKFEPRCLVASGEWLCCGGENGEYAALRFSDKIQSDTPRVRQNELDSEMPIDISRLWRSNQTRTKHRVLQPLVELTKTIGIDIVNCITIWSPPDLSSTWIYQESVAVVSNNDRSVSIVKLKDSEIIDTLMLPDCVNRSVISPDGDMLVSICDDPFLYVHRQNKGSRMTPNELNSTNKGWIYEGKIRLEIPSETDVYESRGSFAAAFSPSGNYLAVATHNGIISVFETKKIYTPPLVIFNSRSNSRVENYIRTLEFSTGPYDLLAWTESKGRVGVADVRNLLLPRQVLILNPNSKGVEKIFVENRITSRRRQDGTSSSRITNHLRVQALPEEHRQTRRLIRTVPDSFTPPHQETEAQDSASPQRLLASLYRRDPAIFTSISARLRSTNTRDLSNQERTLFRFLMNERSRESRWQSEQDLDIEMGNSSNQTRITAPVETEDRVNSATLRHETISERNNEPSSFSPPLSPESDSDYFSLDLEPLERPSVHNSSRLRLVELQEEEVEDEEEEEEEADVAEAAEVAEEAEEAEESRFVSRARNDGRIRVDFSTHRGTMGCCWSLDGAILYAGTEAGIYEFHVDVQSRKRFPSIVYCS